MNSIFKYLRSKLHVLLFLVLELLCIIAIFRFNSYQASFYYSNTRSLSTKLNEMNSSLFDYFALYNKNQALFNENLELRRRMKTNYVLESKAVFEINDTVYKQRYRYYPAQVITNSTNKQNNYITINRGSSSGLQKGMGVFCPDGIVGTITEVSENYAIASSVLNISGFKLVPKIKELNYTKGTIVWDGKDPNYLDLREINKYEALKIGYHIVTSPYSKNYPEDIPIGIIEKLEKNPKETYYRVKVKSAVNFGKIQTVYVVIDMFKDEIDKLEKQVEEKEKKVK
ncbi:MAG: rod shape-determining protein MreC [Chitinophagaceae bacterium]